MKGSKSQRTIEMFTTPQSLSKDLSIMDHSIISSKKGVKPIVKKRTMNESSRSKASPRKEIPFDKISDDSFDRADSDQEIIYDRK
jgi:hypothetical protein